jgi:hypothetical protein
MKCKSIKRNVDKVCIADFNHKIKNHILQQQIHDEQGISYHL